MVQIFSCIGEASVPIDLFACTDLISGGILWKSVFISIMLFFIIGWSILRDIETGLAIGGFICALLGIAALIINLIDPYTAMIPAIFMILGIIIILTKKG